MSMMDVKRGNLYPEQHQVGTQCNGSLGVRVGGIKTPKGFESGAVKHRSEE